MGDLRSDYAALVEHHRQCELAGTRLAELVKREVIGGGGGVDDDELIAAVEAWDAHQWPDPGGTRDG